MKTKIYPFNCIVEDINSTEFVSYDVMPYFVRCYRDEKKKPETVEDFKAFVKQKGKYMYWSRCEYEIVLRPWGTRRTPDKKIDVWYQIEQNLDTVVMLLMKSVGKG